MTGDQCRAEGQLVTVFQANYLVFVHVLLITVITLMMILFVDRRIVNIADGERYQDNKTFLRASDITTIISTTLMAVRMTTSPLVAVSTWRCAFFLLEMEGLSLRQFNRVVSWHIPWPVWMGASRNFFAVTLVLLLMLPSSMVAPLLSGAVDWRPTEQLIDTEPIPVSDGGAPYYWFAIKGGLSQPIFSAVGFVSLAWANIQYPDTGGYRHVMSTTLPINSTVQDATLAYIKIHNLTWDETPLPEYLMNTVENSSNISLLIGDSPSIYGNSGNAVLFDNTTLSVSQIYDGNSAEYDKAPPPSSIFSGVKNVAVLLTDLDTTDCQSLVATPFGSVDTMARLSKYIFPKSQSFGNPSSGKCFVLGTVNFTAGVIKSPESVCVSNRVIEARNIPEIEPDPWVEMALYMMPDVMSKVSVMNTSQMATWDSLNNYVETLLRYSYLSSWDSLNYYFGSLYVDPPANIKAQQSISMLQATVSHQRVFGWLAAQLLLTLSSFILCLIQGRCQRPVIVDIAAVAITTDPKPLLDKRPGLTNMSCVTKEDAEMGKLRLTATGEGGRLALGPS